MMNQSTRRKASALAAGAAALLLWTPIAGADDPPDCDQLQGEQLQQCQDQKNMKKGAGIANDAIDQAKQGADQAKQAADQAKQAADQAQQAADQGKQAADQAKQGADQAKQGADQGKKAMDLSDKNCWVVNGVPTMWSPAMATHPGDVVGWCPQVYGLTPH